MQRDLQTVYENIIDLRRLSWYEPDQSTNKRLTNIPGKVYHFGLRNSDWDDNHWWNAM